MKDWRDAEIAGKFLTGIRGAIPLAATQFEIISRIVKEFCPTPRVFLDLGCGDGILGRYIHDQYPDAVGVYLDYSEPMITELQKKLVHNSKVLVEDYSNSQWLNTVEDTRPFDLIISGYSIHHLQHEEKKVLYGQIFDLLKPGGLFLNLEHVASETPEIEKIHDKIFIESIAEYQKESKSEETVRMEYYDRDDKVLNILEKVEVQCGWLKKTGFNNVDCYFKIFELALFGGTKPMS